MKKFYFICLSLLSCMVIWLSILALPFQSIEEFILKLRLHYKSVELYFSPDITLPHYQFELYQAELYNQLTISTEQQFERQLDAHLSVVDLLRPVDQQTAYSYFNQALQLEQSSQFNQFNSASMLVTQARLRLYEENETEAVRLFQLALPQLGASEFEDKKRGLALERLCSVYWHNSELTQALDWCKQSLDWSQQSEWAAATDKATSFHNLAVVELQLGHTETAVKLFQHAFDQRQSSSTAISLEQANHLQGLASAYADLTKFKQAEWALLRALEITKQVLPTSDSRLSQIVHNLAENKAEQGEYKIAYSYSKYALELALTDPDYPEAELGATYHQLASRAQDLSLMTEAEEYYKSGLTVLRSAHTGKHQDIATLLNNFGTFYEDQDNLEKAKDYYEQALSMRLDLYGNRHPDVAMTQNNLALVLDEQGDTAAAKELLEQAVETTRRLMGSTHLYVSTMEVNLGRMYHDIGDHRAEQLLKTALVNQQNTLGSKHPKLLPTLIGLADYYKDQNKLLDAEQLYHRALIIAETSLPPEHPDLASCLYRLARIYQLKHDYAKAEVFYQKELRILRHNKSPDEEIQGTIKRLLEVLKASGKTLEAKELQQKI